MTRARQLAAGISGFVLGLSLVACSNQGLRDLEDVPVTDPDKSRIVVNVDRFPNVVALCIEGAGFAATTRDSSNAALQHIPTWDAPSGWCGDGVKR